MLKVLLLDRDDGFRRKVAQEWDLPETSFREAGFEQPPFGLLESDAFDLVFLDAGAIWQDGVDLVSWIRSRHPECQVSLLADAASRTEARAALSRGGHEVLVKPLDTQDLAEATRHAGTHLVSRTTERSLQTQVLEDMLGDTPGMRKILRIAHKVAPTTSTVLITGESGTGKEFFGNILHRLSDRREGPFVAVNCGAIPETLVESELFGVRKGSYTGATADRKGLFEEAEFGTLFLDEVGELPASAQVKLLRFLQNHEVRRVGDSETRIVDVRVIAATNRDLQAEVAAGRFREDLWFRLNVFHLHLPPLRERMAAVPSLCRFFLHRFCQIHRRDLDGFDHEAEQILLGHFWPGNIRELENAVEHAVVMAEGRRIRVHDLPESVVLAPRAMLQLPPSQSVAEDPRGSLRSLADVERAHILHVLDVLEGNQTEASLVLGIGRSTLWRKLREYGLAEARPVEE